MLLSSHEALKVKLAEIKAGPACPNCSHQCWIGGPCGGLSQNVLCANCQYEYNDMGPFGLDPIQRSPEERLAIYGEKFKEFLEELFPPESRPEMSRLAAGLLSSQPSP